MSGRLLALVGTALLAVGAALPIDDIVVGSSPVVVAATSAIVATLVVVVIDRVASRHDGRFIAVGGAIAAVGVAVSVSVADRSAGSSIVDAATRDVVDAMVHGWADLATTPTPAAASTRLLVPLSIAIFAAAALGAAVVVCRPSLPFAPLAPGCAAIVAGAVAAGGTGSRPIVLATAVIIGVGLVLLGRQRILSGGDTTRTRPWARSLALGAAVSTVSLVAVGAASAALGSADDPDAFDPRDHLAPPTAPTDATDALDLVTAMRLQPDTVLATVEIDGAAAFRLATLDRFDGARWTTSATYRRFGQPITEASGTPGARVVTAQVAVAALEGPWLPGVDVPLAFTGAAALFDPSSGTFLVDDASASTSSPSTTLEYELIAEIVDPSVAALRAGLPTADRSTDAPSRTLPDSTPVELRELAATLTDGAPSAFDEAVLLSDHLASNVRSDRSIPGGSSLGQIAQLVGDGDGDGDGDEGRRAGNDAQVAAAFAVLGRAADLPTRIVVGFDPAVTASPGRHELRAGDLRVWPEVEFDQAGWVPFRIDSSTSGAGGVLVGSGGDQAVVIADAEPVVPTESVPAPPPIINTAELPRAPERVDAADASRGAWPLLAGGGMLLLVALGAGAIVVTKRARTRRRRSVVDARPAVLAAWDDVLERLDERAPARAARIDATVEDVVEADPDLAPILAGLYGPVQQALYGDEVMGDDDVERAWRCRDRLVARHRETTPLAGRLRCQLDPRPLRRDAARGRHEVTR